MNNLTQILDKHQKWLNGEEDGEKADLSGADLSHANLSHANLVGANLSDANLSGADLSGADLSDADLSLANLSRADLSRANLSRANLSRANLSRANLIGAYLSLANLSLANLSGANLYISCADNVVGLSIVVFSINEGHRLVYRRDTEEVRIGCERHPLKYWIDNYKDIGKKHDYSDFYINMYGTVLKGIWDEQNKDR